MFAAIGAAFSFLFGLFQSGIDIIVQALVWSVKALWAFAVFIYNAVKSVGGLLRAGFQKAWGFFRTVYDDVLKPAWTKFWQLFDRVRTWLKDVFGPVFKFLLAVRDEILCFYKTWIKPILNVIDATRQVLRVLEALHLKFAYAIDAWLGQLEHYINYPFQLVLSKLNEVIGWVGRIATLDGLLQRVALIRSLQRDIAYVHATLTNTLIRGYTDVEIARQHRFGHTQSTPALIDDLAGYLKGEQSDVGQVIDSMVDALPAYLESLA